MEAIKAQAIISTALIAGDPIPSPCDSTLSGSKWNKKNNNNHNIIEDYLKTKEGKITDKRIKQIRISLNLFNSRINLIQANNTDINNFILDGLNIEKLANGSLNQRIAMLKGFYSWCVLNNYLIKNPCTGRKFFKEKYDDHIEHLTKQERDFLLKFIDENNVEDVNIALWIALHAGMRIEEI